MDDQPARPIDNLIKPFLNKNVDFDLSIELSLFGRIDTYFSKKKSFGIKNVTFDKSSLHKKCRISEKDAKWIENWHI